MSIKKMLLTALAAAFAFAALPAMASADPELHNESGTYPITFTGHSVGQTFLTTTANNPVECSSATSHGEFENGTTGKVQLLFHGCESSGVSCRSEGQESGTITTTVLPFHLKTNEHNGETEDAVLITSNEGHFASFTCFFVSVQVTGNGIVGTITAPDYNTPTKEATLTFESTEPGHQTHKTVEGDETEYTLKSSRSGGTPEPASQDGHGTLTFGEDVTLTE